MEWDKTLKPCPHCSGFARFGETAEGGRFIECSQCLSSSNVMFPLKEPVDDLLREAWNRRWTDDKEVQWLREFRSHVMENGGVCENEDDPSVGMFRCVTCHPDEMGE